MHNREELLALFESELKKASVFPPEPRHLYDPARYILYLKGKRIRPILSLMAAELFGELSSDAFDLAMAIEIFHNFTLIHDDIMDEAPLRRGNTTAHLKYGSHAALLAGDVMLVQAFSTLNKIQGKKKEDILLSFARTARAVCEGQQMDMDLEQKRLDEATMEGYIRMISLKTAVLLAASLQMGGLQGGGSSSDGHHLYQLGENIGIAFQIQDDYLDAFGNSEKFGKQRGGDILSNKKTFLLIKSYEVASVEDKKKIYSILTKESGEEKVRKMLDIYQTYEVDRWAETEKKRLAELAEEELTRIDCLESRKVELRQWMLDLLNRES